MADALPLLPELSNRAIRASRRIGAAVAVLGLLVLLGWTFDVPALKSVLPGTISMKVNTALAFLCCGASLAIPPASAAHRHVTFGLAGAAGWIGLITLAECLFGLNLGIDQALFRDDPGAVATLHPGRMAPTTATAFMLCSLTLVLRERWPGMPRIFPALAFLIAWSALLGYTYDVPLLYGIFSFNPMAIHTACGLLALSVGTLLCEPKRGIAALFLSATTGGALMRRILPLLLLLPAALGWIRLEWQRAGGLELAAGVAIFTLAHTIVLGGFVIWFAARLAITDAERSRAFAELGRAHDELERRVAERTAQLAQTNERLAAELFERRTVDEALHVSREELRGAFESAAIGMAFVSPAGRWLKVNPALCRLIGYSEPELLSIDFQTITHPDDLTTDLGYVQQVLDGKIPSYQMEKRYFHKQGQVVWILLSVALVRYPDGRPLHFVCQIQDISERKSREAEIRRLNAELAGRVEELQTANRELEAFSYSVSHDLRSPLRAIDGYARILIDEHAAGLDATGRSRLETVCACAREMGELIDDLLEFSRLQRQPMTRESVRPEELVRRCIASLEATRSDRRVEWRIGPLPSCRADPAMLQRVYANLLQNAAKFSRDRAPAVIEIGAETEDGATAYFVRDNGVGYDPQYAGKLFGVFQRLHRQEEFEGTGIGLALVQRIIHRHGGRVWGESAPDQGATFRFTLGGDQSHAL